MKTLFVGPSLHGAAWDRSGLDVRGPARQGDIHSAVSAGATAIGLVDGVFGTVPSVWHKEILHALSLGVRVLGGGSLGALRAAECQDFGMEPVGGIAAEYATGAREADADVCLAHCPAELDYLPLSEPLVDVEATLAALETGAHLQAGEIVALLAAARALYFADRTIEAMVGNAGLPPQRSADVAAVYRTHSVHRKRADALAVVSWLRTLPDQRGPAPGWTFVVSDPWRHYVRTAGQR